MEDATLPEEIIVLILSWLPVKSLLRFTSVSKRFHSIILSDPNFAHSQFQAARDRKTSTDRLLLSVTGPRFQSLDVDAPSFGDHSSVRELKFPLLAPGAEVVLLGSCNGIVFLAFDNKIFYWWNPSTGFFKKLPDPPFSTNGNVRNWLFHYGVGYLPAVDDYRVFVSSYASRYEVAIFSSSADAWTTVLELDVTTVFPYHGILLKEALHWLDVRRVIVAFDLAQEEKHEFRTMLLPEDSDGASCEYDKHLGVSAGGCLSIVRFERVSGDWVQWGEVWVMGEYGVHDSWTKLFNLMFPDPLKEPVLVPEETTSMVTRIFVHNRTRCGDILVKIFRIEEGKCSVYETVGASFNMIHYQESLLRIDD